ncbi:PIG-L deacetylase family protein [Massilia glaciei]|uniref:PIG-L family deacetylase n=1 Tax=Massilia glaciei TaxID=1524097 RepID=A0A2U2HGE7_9BURK|nr:PIG-L family deacetylase [Massilia glaciei]PWF44001.1 PIG-L family deacetylase [Massilia glaciei]
MGNLKARPLLDQLDFDAFERVVILSPHLDDAALSCGGLLHALQGVPTLVVTLCSGNPPPLVSVDGASKTPARRGHVSPRIRRAEDVAAMRAIEAAYVHLSFPDAIYRRGPTGKLIYPSARGRWIAPRDDDAAHIEELFQLLRRICLDLGPILLVSPMGIGDHVDHQITARVAMRLAAAAAGAKLLFYEDFPYVADPHSGRGGDGPEAALARLQLEPTERFVVPVDIEGKMRVLRHYTSQVPVLFGGDEGMRAAIAGYQHGGTACECYWRAGKARDRHGSALPAINKGNIL